MSAHPVGVLPPQSTLRELLDYDPDSGVFTWRRRTGRDNAAARFNGRRPGTEAFTALTVNGYRHGHLLAQRVLAHRVAWKWWHGTEPAEIDHVNGDRADNRIANLRSVSRSANARNQGLRRSNKTGVPGVFWYERYRAYQVMIANQHIGRFERFEDAVAARREAEQRFNFHPNHGRREARA